MEHGDPGRLSKADSRSHMSRMGKRMQISGLDGETLLVQGSRTGQAYRVPIQNGSIRATDLRQVQVDTGDSELVSYDPGLVNTALCRSAITFIDGERGILRYRGYPIDELAGRRSFLDVAYLLIYGELPGSRSASGRAGR